MMSGWRSIETLADVPPLEQVLVWRPGGKVRAMKAVLARRPALGFTHWMPPPQPPPIDAPKRQYQPLPRKPASPAGTEVLRPVDAPSKPARRAKRQPRAPARPQITDDAGQSRLLEYYERKARELQERADRLRATMAEIDDEKRSKAVAKEVSRLENQATLHRESAERLG